MQKKSYKGRIILLTLIIAGVLFLHYMGVTNYLTVAYLKENSARIKLFIAGHFLVSALAFVGILASAVALSLPLGIVMPITGGFLFGWIPGAALAIIGATIGGMTAFLASRYLIGEYFQTRFGDRLKAFNAELDKYGFLYLLGLHFFPVTPFFVLNILSGLTNVSIFTFFWTTIVGVMPAFSIYSYIGNQLTEIDEFRDLFSGKILIAFIALKALSVITLLVGRFGPRLFKRSKA